VLFGTIRFLASDEKPHPMQVQYAHCVRLFFGAGYNVCYTCFAGVAKSVNLPKDSVKMIIKKPLILVVALFLGLFAYAPKGDAAARDGLLRTVEVKRTEAKSLPKWAALVKKLPDERKLFKACLTSEAACPDKAYVAWRDLMKAASTKPQEEQIRRINRYVNSWPYRTDMDAWNKPEYWAAPSEFLKKSGDAEDFAIMKYLSLSLAGIAPDNLRVVVVRDVLRNKTHAVVALYQNGRVFILDNLIDAILPEESVLQYAPIYSVNEQAHWIHMQQELKNRVTSQTP